ncbi:OLC1v1022768C1 [Oldenlandia corymbosa var. corymbosa]|uniref:OLC1v1022768C1 n=1 Tax=Oldenlandia corymbosa var. corymbosa TaxID=529605 RepID=A0AAV1BYN9_OLDCO|nr:OLC1v1022768C1 [Oldenlandia corymbosa var. corymbosa]
MSESSNGRIMEEREEQMISPTGDGGSNGDVTFRLAHFLSPTVASDHSLLPEEVPSSTFSSPEKGNLKSSETEEVEEELLSRGRSELFRSKSKPNPNRWSQKFMDSGSNIEHAAFLALWLSMFVFPTKNRDCTVGRHVFTIAILLAKGTKIALAPAVLASLYANLSEMKRALVISSSKKDEILEVSISAPFQLLQIWVWERFVSLRPNPLPLETDQPRFAKWNNLRVKNIGDVKSTIDYSADLFLWRPYSVGSKSLFPHEIYKKEARWITVNDSSIFNEEQEILVRWVRVGELVGIDSNCIEQYLPHRVAMQFGFDQDVPGLSDVTTRYLEWWKNCNCRPGLSGDPVINNHQTAGMCTPSSSLLDRSPIKRKKFSKLEKSSNTRRKFSRRYVSLSEMFLKEVSVVSSTSSPTSTNLEGMPHSEDTHRQHQTELLRNNASGEKGKAPNVIKLTGSDYRKAIATQIRPNSMQELMESETASSKDSGPEKGRAKEMVRSPVSLSSSEKNLKDDDAVVHPGFHSNEVTPHPKDTDALGRKDNGSNMINPTGSEHKDGGFEDQIRLNSTQQTVESEKEISKRGLECEDQETDADSNKFVNTNTRNGRKCRFDALKDLLTQWGADCSHLESIVAKHKRNHCLM